MNASGSVDVKGGLEHDCAFAWCSENMPEATLDLVGVGDSLHAIVHGSEGKRWSLLDHVSWGS